MGQFIFGGTHGKPISDYFDSLHRPIAVQLEKQLKSAASKEKAKSEVKKMFTIALFHFDMGKGTIKDTNGDDFKMAIIDGQNRKLFIKSYSYSIPFTGEPGILNYRPETFHGSAINGDVNTDYDKETSILTVLFNSERNNQEAFNHEKSLSIGELSANANEANKAIKNWNEARLDKLIDNLYETVLAHITETKNFNKRNNIN